METLRFLMVSTFYPPYHLGGDATHVQYLAQALSERGHEVHVEFSPAAYNLKRKGDPASATIEHDGIRLHPIPSPYGRMQPIAAHMLGRSKGVTRFHENLMKGISPDIVHFHNISLLGLGVLGQTHAPRTLYTAHDYWIRCPRSDLFKYGRFPCDAPTCTRCALVSRRPPQVWRTERAWRDFRKVDCVIAPSRFMAKAIEQEVTCPIVHIPNFAPDHNPDGRTWEPRDYYLYVGDHHVRKGVMELAQAASMRPEALSVVFVGHGRDERRLRGLQKKKLADIDVRGWVSPLELTRLYRKARALIIPSLWHDNSPLVGIEALSWGTPLLVSRRGGLEELTSGGEAGSSFEPHATDILSTLDGFEEEGLPQRLREPARRAYEAHHNPDVYLRAYMSVTEGERESLQEAKAPGL